MGKKRKISMTFRGMITKTGSRALCFKAGGVTTWGQAPQGRDLKTGRHSGQPQGLVGMTKRPFL